jgi:hypothetical protein
VAKKEEDEDEGKKKKKHESTKMITYIHLFSPHTVKKLKPTSNSTNTNEPNLAENCELVQKVSKKMQ